MAPFPHRLAPRVPLALLAAFLSSCGTLPVRDDAQASLVAAERAFAAHAGEHGIRDAFLRHFAPGGIVFAPGPARVDEAFAQPPDDPRAVLLEWWPAASGVAASGDFGYTTGPARIAPRDGSRPPRHATFFSVWKRARDGPWRVVVDAGVRLPGPRTPGEMPPGPAVRPAAHGADASLAALLAVERGTWTRDTSLARLAPDVQLQRGGAFPVQGADAVAAAWPDGDETLDPLGGDVAASADLAYTYGRVASAAGDGHYLHLWTRAPDGRAWRLGAVLRLP
jgi:ketosteroid isomerase-like protein